MFAIKFNYGFPHDEMESIVFVTSNESIASAASSLQAKIDSTLEIGLNQENAFCAGVRVKFWNEFQSDVVTQEFFQQEFLAVVTLTANEELVLKEMDNSLFDGPLGFISYLSVDKVKEL